MRYISHTISAVALCGILTTSQSAQAQTTYHGQAVVVNANVAGILNVAVSDTGQLPPDGGALSVSLASLSLPPTLDLHLLTANTVGQNDQTTSNAAVVDVAVNVPGVYITASVLNSTANAVCMNDHAEISGASTIVGLKVNGWPIKITGKPNQTVPLIVGSLVINEQIGHVTAAPLPVSGDMVVNALHLKINLVADVVISDSHAGVDCPPQVVPE